MESNQTKTGLIAPQFWKRSFTVLGHSLIAQAIIAVPVVLLLYFLGVFN